MMRSRFVVIAVATACFALAAGCGAAPDEEQDDGEETAPEQTVEEALAGNAIVQRATSWADARLKYCGGVNGGHDSICGGTCSRQHNAAWDAYRSDCSGLVSYAWGLPAPGQLTTGLPSRSRGTKAISSLQPGDAINSSGHTMIFASWHNTKLRQANLIEEPGCGKTARKVTYTLNVGCSGTKGATIQGYSGCFIGLAHP